MSEPIPFLGSKISLISKSEIRYEGILYTIDAQESIIVLTKVQSFGTEDRPAELVVPAKNDVYEYIIFRGTDIKKIEVCDTKPPIPALHNDPAIVGLQVQQHAAPSIATSYPGATFGHQQTLGAIGSVGNYYSSYSQPMGGQQNLPSSGFSIGVSQPSEFSGGIGSSVGGVGVEAHSPPGTVGAAVGGGSGGGSGSSSSNQQSLPAPIGAPPQSSLSTRSQQQQPQSQSQQRQPQQQQQDVLSGSRSSTPGVSRKSPVADAGVQVSPPPQSEKRRSIQSTQRRQQTPERQVREGGQGPSNYNRRNQYQNQYGQHQQMSRYNQGGNQGYSQGYNQGNQGYNQGGNQGYYQHQGMGNQQYQGQFRGGAGRGRAPRRSQPRGGGGGRGGSYNQGNRQRQDQQIFEKEFDFEQANEEFEELRHQMANTKISENGAVDEKVPPAADDKKDDSGHETATTGDESEDSSSSSVYYDKTKSFFDSISCEALERSKGKSQRSDWRQERKINVQTFGVATARRGYYPRGGRGGYYNRGGYYRNYNQGYYSYRNSRGGGMGNPGGGGFGGGGGGNRVNYNSSNSGGGGGGSSGGNINGTDSMNHLGTGAATSGPPPSYASAVRSVVTSVPAK